MLEHILKETENAKSFITVKDVCESVFKGQMKSFQEIYSLSFIETRASCILTDPRLLKLYYNLSIYQFSTIFYQLQILPADVVWKELLKSENSNKVDPRVNDTSNQIEDTGKDTPSCSTSIVIENKNMPGISMIPSTSTSMNPGDHNEIDGDAQKEYVSGPQPGIGKPGVQNPTNSSTEPGKPFGTKIEDKPTFLVSSSNQDGSELLNQNKVEIGDSMEASVVQTPSKSNTNTPDFEDNIPDISRPKEISVDKCIDYSWDLETFLKQRSYDQTIVCGKVDLCLDVNLYDDYKLQPVHMKVILTARLDGFQYIKYPPFVILPLKYLKPEDALKRLYDIFQDTIEFTFSPDSVLNDDCVYQFLVSTIKYSTKSRLLVWESNAANRSEIVKEFLSKNKLDALFVPEEVADVFQPTNVYWKPAFQAKIRQKYAEWRTISKDIPSSLNVFDWIRVAWNSIPEETIRESLVGCGLAGWPEQLLSTNIHCFQKYGSMAEDVKRMMAERWKLFKGITRRQEPCFETFFHRNFLVEDSRESSVVRNGEADTEPDAELDAELDEEANEEPDAGFDEEPSLVRLPLSKSS
ncbi:hypothetical protein GCK72_020953 [Caenorhabditis remanei]|uniref:DDE-1 domain-containing protein n=1 Tax=Caenorhabditis remanei TaxID=31234 RepID=A0A6A5GIN4_CAERE|nr:hypothetical protein GCK72_020953 [Caenorhabditis remanei]KAF1754392.1 hypothetical protein GCK72_020953 [Caenorhabditis remanei]